MRFERLFDRIRGGSIWLGTIFGDYVYIKRWQYLWDQERSFLGHVFANFYQNILHQKGNDPIDPVVTTQYDELKDETICIEQPTITALQCIKNQLLTRSGRIYMDQSL